MGRKPEQQHVTKLSTKGANLGTFKVGDGAAGIAFDGTNVWVVNNGDSTVMKVSPSSGTVITTYATGKGPFAWPLMDRTFGCRTSEAIQFR